MLIKEGTSIRKKYKQGKGSKKNVVVTTIRLAFTWKLSSDLNPLCVTDILDRPLDVDQSRLIADFDSCHLVKKHNDVLERDLVRVGDVEI